MDENVKDTLNISADQEKEMATTEDLVVKLENVQEGEVKKTRDDAFQDLISGMVDYAEKKIRDYELAIKKGDFTVDCPYSESALAPSIIRLNSASRRMVGGVSRSLRR